MEFNQAIAASNERLQVLEENHKHATAENDRLHALAIAGAFGAFESPTISKYLPRINADLY